MPPSIASKRRKKAFKGFLAWHDQSFRKTHNLEELGRQIAGIDPTLETLVDRTATLTEYASAFRYPGESEDPSREEVEAALALAREAYEAILARLPEDVRP